MVGPVRFGLFPVTGTNEQMLAKAPFRGDYKLAGVQISRRALSPILVLRVHTVHRVCASPSHEQLAFRDWRDLCSVVRKRSFLMAAFGAY